MEYIVILNPSKKDIDEVLELDKMFYKDEYLWSKEYQNKIFNANEDSFILIKYNNKLIGYMNYLCITKEKYESMKKSNITVDSFDVKDICKFQKGDNYITINSIVINKEHQNRDVVKLVNDSFLEKLVQYEKKEINIKGIDGIAISNDGRKYLENIGLKKYKELDDGNALYILEENPVLAIQEAISKIKQKMK